MNRRVEHVLDRLEPRVIKGRDRWLHKPPPKWVRPLMPAWYLKPTEDYTLRLYFRESLIVFAPVCVFMLLGMVAPFVYLWHRFPWFLHRALFHRGWAHKALIGLLAHFGYYWMPYYLLFLLAFNLALYLPTRYFWNRRARRLRAERPPEAGSLETVPADPTVWPPAPVRPENMPAR